MEGESSVESGRQPGTDVGSFPRRGRQERPLDARSRTEQYLGQEPTHLDHHLGHEDDLLDRYEDEEVIADDMHPDAHGAHRRTASPADCSMNRKSNKPMMEKKRRQRINRCLNDLKTLVLEALKKDPSRYSKLEKADILEMTVRHVQLLHRQQQQLMGGRMMNSGRVVGGEDASKYRAGFSQCANEVTKYLSSLHDLPTDLHSKILSHLNAIATSVTTNINTNATCVTNSVNVTPNPAPIILVLNNATAVDTSPPTLVSSIQTQPISYHDNAGNSMGAQPQVTVVTAPTHHQTSGTTNCTQQQQQHQPGSYQLLPTRLNNGNLAVVLPTTFPMATQKQDVRPSPSAALQASAPVLTAILTSDRNTTSVVQPPALSTVSEDSALGAECLDISDSDTSSGVCTPMSSMSSAGSPLPAEEAGRTSPKKGHSSRSSPMLKSQVWNSSTFREELNSSPCTSRNVPRRQPLLAPKPTYAWEAPPAQDEPPTSRKDNVSPPEPADPQSMWRPWH